MFNNQIIKKVKFQQNELPRYSYNYFNSFVCETFFTYDDSSLNPNLVINLDLNKIISPEEQQGKQFAIRLKAFTFDGLRFKYTSPNTIDYKFPSLYFISSINNTNPTYQYICSTQGQIQPISRNDQNVEALIQITYNSMWDPVNVFGVAAINGKVSWSKLSHLNGDEQVSFNLQTTDINGNFIPWNISYFTDISQNANLILIFDLYTYVTI